MYGEYSQALKKSEISPWFFNKYNYIYKCYDDI